MDRKQNTPKIMPTQEELKSLLRYEQETGRLFWRLRPNEAFPSLRAAKVWNSRYANQEALSSVNSYGYKEGSIFNSRHRAHRIIWAMHYGPFTNDIDHINGDRLDNRLLNLRSVTRAANLQNCCIRSDNSSGVVGVDEQKGKWRARIKAKTIGLYDSKEEAIAARKKAEVDLGFHPNHGRTTQGT